MPKRGENIRKRKDGRWEARSYTQDGKRKSIYAQSYKEIKEKVKNTNKIGEEKEKAVNLEIVTFENLCIEWLKESEIKNKKSTVARYRTIVEKHLNPYFGRMKLQSINRNQVSAFIASKSSQNLEAKSIYDIAIVFMQIIRYAESKQYIEGFQCDASLPVVARKDLEVLTEKEQESLVSFIKQEITRENIGVLLSLFMGLRIGEICALQYKDIDLNAGQISITKTMQRIATFEASGNKTAVITDTPKSQNSVRKVPIPDFLLKQLKRLSEGCLPNAYLLTGSEKRYIEPRSYQYKFKKWLKQANVRDINFHALRHTFATMAVEKNMDVKTLSEILGHSTVNFTLDRYVHPSFAMKKQNIEKLVACY